MTETTDQVEDEDRASLGSNGKSPARTLGKIGSTFRSSIRKVAERSPLSPGAKGSKVTTVGEVPNMPPSPSEYWRRGLHRPTDLCNPWQPRWLACSDELKGCKKYHNYLTQIQVRYSSFNLLNSRWTILNLHVCAQWWMLRLYSKHRFNVMQKSNRGQENNVIIMKLKLRWGFCTFCSCNRSNKEANVGP